MVGGGGTSYPALSVNDNFIVSNKEKTSTFNDFFLSQSKIDTSNADLPPVTPTPAGIDSIQATESEVLDLVLSLDCTKSARHDGISPKLLRLAGNKIVPSLTKLLINHLGQKKFLNCGKKQILLLFIKRAIRTMSITIGLYPCCLVWGKY